ncbi:P-loop containing nucleoside triphosphate hydrolase protein [Thozetella sp. PMI_491]|nr:P-loop containing nucleoside triphosphate hydrolase protein [Thozetella sp. PMI_491]
MIKAALDDETVAPIPDDAIKTTLKPWQGTGATKLVRLGNSFLGGGILGDRVGMGKTLTSLLAALELRRQLPNPGFILIVCRPTLVLQWYDEIHRHFHDERRPLTIILDTARCLASTLHSYDIVICSNSFLRLRYIERRDWIDYHTALFYGGTQFAEQTYNKKKSEMKFLASPLFSQAQCMAQKGISVLLLDEAHDARGSHTILSEALRALNYKYALLVTGTPIINTFKDFYGLLALLPGCPFVSLAHYMKVIDPQDDDDDDATTHESRKARAKQIFHQINRTSTLARSGKLLQLSHPVIQTVDVDFRDEEALIMSIARLVRLAMFILKKANEGEANRITGFMLLATAQKKAASPLLPSRSPQGIRFADNDMDDEQMETALENGILDVQAWQESQMNDEYVPTDSETGSESEPESGSATGDNKPEGNDARDFPQPREANVEIAKKSNRSNPKYAREWLEKLANATDAAVLSPRVVAIISTARKITAEHPEDKIVIVSQSHMFLDVILEGLRRQLKPMPRVAEYNGTVPKDKRPQIQRDFNYNASGSKILLLTEATGGAGLNLHGGNHIILAEPFPTPGQLAQVIGRVDRLGQMKTVYIYKVQSPLSAVDKYYISKMEEKLEFSNENRQVVLRH